MQKLKNTKILTISAMLTAIAIILGFFKIPVTSLIEIRFDFLPLALGGQLFGPVVAGIIGVISDVGAYLVHPTGPYFPGFSVSALVTGLIYGLILHGKHVTVLRCFFARLLHTAVIGFLLNPLWLSILYGNGFFAILSARLVKEIVMLPIQTALLFLVSKAMTAPVFRRLFAGAGA